MKLKYYYSACVGIKTPDVSILCDPWFTDGVYDGAWYQYPKFENALERIERYDLIYISHIHPDHYDSVFLRQYLKKYPDTRIIAKERFLINCLRKEGFKLYEGNGIKNTEFQIFLNDTGSASDIDTALVVKYLEHSIVNMNDNPFDEKQIQDIKDYIGKKPTIALLGYTGAGPYPQNFYTDPLTLIRLAEEKKQEFFRRYKQFDKALNAKINIPFAGQYLLGGKLAYLNNYRGVADATEVLGFDCKSLVMKEDSEIDCSFNSADIANCIRTEPYDKTDMAMYIQSISSRPLDYETLNLDIDKIPFERLLRKAYERAMKANEYKGENYSLIITLPKGYYICNLNSYAEKSYYSDDITEGPRLILELDFIYLFGLITGIYHWNNAIVGSHITYKREPDIFNRDVQRFLNFFYV